jgi:hypothetical protein
MPIDTMTWQLEDDCEAEARCSRLGAGLVILSLSLLCWAPFIAGFALIFTG